jgi:hypothetical protein
VLTSSLVIDGDPKTAVPPDDSGSDTFARFRYQAHATFPLCLFAVTTNDIRSVIPEHFEDIAVEGTTGWRFLQVKTRNPGSGPWTLSSVLPPTGALQSLWRAYTHLGTAVDATYEMVLEGTLKSGDDIHSLASPAERRALAETLSTRLSITKNEAEAFLDRVRLMVSPPRTGIADRNIRLLAAQAPSLPSQDIQRTYEQVLAAIEAAMTADRLSDSWPRSVLDPDFDRNAGRLSRKILTRPILAELMKNVIDPTSPRGTDAVSAAARPVADSDSAVVRRFIAEALSDDELNDLCHDYYQEVWRQFTASMAGRRKISLLIEYCVRRRCLRELADRVRKFNAPKYDEFAARLQSVL